MPSIPTLLLSAAVMLSWLFGSTRAAAPRALPIPFNEPFSAETIASRWTTDLSTESAIRVEAGELIIETPDNTFAHVQSPLDANFVRASCAIKPAGASASHPTSLALYWKSGDWCQIGMVPDDGGHVYVVETREGETLTYRLSACNFNEFSYVAIELGIENIRFLSSADGKSWKVERLAIRPESYTGAPELLIAGKGYGRGLTSFEPNPFEAPDLDNNAADRGARVVSRIRDLRVEPTAGDRLRLSAEEKAEQELTGRDLLGEQELAKPGDPTFESVSAYYPALKYPREVVGVKDHPLDIGVGSDATLEMADFIYLMPETQSPDDRCPRAYFEIGSPAVRFGRGGAGCDKTLLEGYLPVVIARFEHEGLRYKQTIFGHSQSLRTDLELFAYVRLEVSNPTTETRKTSWVANSAPKEGEPYRQATEFELGAGVRRSQCFKVPYSLKPATVAEIPDAEYDACLKEVTESWTKLLNSGMRVTVPEQRVNDAFRAWQAYNCLNVDQRGDVFHLCDGSSFYEIPYGYSAALYCHALDLLGHHTQAEQYIDSLLTFQRGDGLFMVNFGLPDNGTLLRVMAEHYRLTNDEAWLRRVAPKMIAMCNYVLEKRKATMTHVHVKRPLVYGLIFGQAYCDHPLPAISYFAETYNCVGMEDTARVLGAIGMKDEAERLARESAAYRRDIEISMDRAVFERNGIRILPIMPETHTLLKESGFQAGDYYGLNVGMLLEDGFLPPSDPKADLLIGMMERRGGLVLGISKFRNMIDHAYTYGYLMNRLERDEVRKVILGFYGWMSYGMSRGTYSGVECTNHATGNNTYTLPHTYSGTQQMRLLRMMLLREEGQNLLLGYALPSHWLKAGDVVKIEHAPTVFGETSFSIESHVDEGYIKVHVDPPVRQAPATLKIRLRHAEGKAIASVQASGSETVVVSGNVIEVARPTAAPLDLKVLY